MVIVKGEYIQHVVYKFGKEEIATVLRTYRDFSFGLYLFLQIFDMHMFDAHDLFSICIRIH